MCMYPCDDNATKFAVKMHMQDQRGLDVTHRFLLSRTAGSMVVFEAAGIAELVAKLGSNESKHMGESIKCLTSANCYVRIDNFH